MMAVSEQFEFEIIFSLPPGERDPFFLSDAVIEAGFGDAVIGTGNPKLLAVELEAPGEDAESAILNAAGAIMSNLPAGTRLHEVRPDLVSLADVAAKLDVTRQTLQQRCRYRLPVGCTGSTKSRRLSGVRHSLKRGDGARAFTPTEYETGFSRAKAHVH